MSEFLTNTYENQTFFEIVHERQNGRTNYNEHNNSSE